MAAACFLVPLAALKSPAQSAKGTISGTVYDISGAAVPDASVTASNFDTHTRETGLTNDAGEYRFAFIPTGRYEIEIKKPGLRFSTRPLSRLPKVSICALIRNSS